VLITIVIAATVVSTAGGVLGRALDAVDPALTDRIRAIAAAVPLVTGTEDVRGRWAGRALFVSLSISLPADVQLIEAHRVAEEVRHELFHRVEHLREVDVHMNPDADLVHELTAHHDGGHAEAGEHADDHHHDEQASAPGGHDRNHGHDGHAPATTDETHEPHQH
jgi:divalent metal cation (Fe/Co/Zn/Cd) transporter